MNGTGRIGSRRTREPLRTHTAPKAVQPGQRSFTLVELVLSLAIMSILMTGLASAILIASHALPDDDSTARAVVTSAEVVNLVAEELQSALWVRERTATSVEFAVPDRDGDGNAERIRYAWSGTAGQALTRQYNGGTVVDVIESVQEFDLGYELETVTEEYPGAPVEGTEELISSHSSVWGAWVSFSIKKDEWPGQYFKPALTADAISWRVTRIFVYAKAEADVEQTLVQIRPADADRKPTTVVLAQAVMDEADLGSSYAWEEVVFDDASALSPDDGYCLVLENGSGGGVSARIVYDDGGGSGGVNTKDGGKSWSYYDWLARLHYVYGKVGTPGPPQTATRQHVTRVRIALRAGDELPARAVTTVQTLNCPELLSAMWETDFDSDPALDHNGDGEPDWEDRSGAFTPSSLAGGVWVDDSELVTFPDNDFATLTTVRVRFRSTKVGGRGVFRIHADQSGGMKVILAANVELMADGTQTLTLLRNVDPATRIVMKRVTGLSSDFVEVRLVIDPDLNTVSATVDGEHQGTHRYSPFVPAVSRHYASILGDGGTAEFDHVSVRVAE